MNKDFQELTLALEGERYRAERLEEQVNDLTELHQVNNNRSEIHHPPTLTNAIYTIRFLFAE